MAFGHVQGNAVNSAAAVATLTVTLAAAPTIGNLVCVSFQVIPTTVSALSIKDGNSNIYVLTPQSPNTTTNPGISVYCAFLLIAPSNATAAVTATWTTNSSYVNMWVEEFSVPNGQVARFDADFIANNTVGATAINSPTVTPTGIQGELLWATVAPTNVVSAPTAGGTAGVWTGAAGGIIGGNMSEYDLSATAAQAANFTQAPAGSWNSMGMAFYLAGNNLAISGAGA